ncbi:phage tail assembly protein [Aeromonas sp. sia0103]|uniref:phage tail assembly protein n=1 Tax=Aeromonas sp. sia0103 TaxID=2854782 RepID=UPI001C48A79B|nr:phage tail assembly protein [Aeromonas sp. sia0103]MBV7598923.1 phage tail assembly protein [Aeromonas sp. sia0103]
MEQPSITLTTPIQRGEQVYTELTLTKPAKVAQLRGINTVELLNLNVDALIKFIPRVSTPSLTEQEVGNLDPADLLQAGMVIIGFFIKPEVAFLPA